MNTRPAELYHHGIMGMHWGVRRYQNEDGSLTPKGKERYNEVASSERLSQKNTRQAMQLLTKKRNKAVFQSEYSKVASQDEINKMLQKNAKAEVAKARGNINKQQKLLQKGAKHLENSYRHFEAYEKFTKDTKILDKKISNISSGKLKAGRDFIIQTDWNVYGIPGVFYTVSRDRTLVEKRK